MAISQRLGRIVRYDVNVTLGVVANDSITMSPVPKIRIPPTVRADNQFGPHLQVQVSWVSDPLRYVLRQEGSGVLSSQLPCVVRKH